MARIAHSDRQFQYHTYSHIVTDKMQMSAALSRWHLAKRPTLIRLSPQCKTLPSNMSIACRRRLALYSEHSSVTLYCFDEVTHKWLQTLLLCFVNSLNLSPVNDVTLCTHEYIWIKAASNTARFSTSTMQSGSCCFKQSPSGKSVSTMTAAACSRLMMILSKSAYTCLTSIGIVHVQWPCPRQGAVRFGICLWWDLLNWTVTVIMHCFEALFRLGGQACTVPWPSAKPYHAVVYKKQLWDQLDRHDLFLHLQAMIKHQHSCLWQLSHWEPCASSWHLITTCVMLLKNALMHESVVSHLCLTDAGIRLAWHPNDVQTERHIQSKMRQCTSFALCVCWGKHQQ